MGRPVLVFTSKKAEGELYGFRWKQHYQSSSLTKEVQGIISKPKVRGPLDDTLKYLHERWESSTVNSSVLWRSYDNIQWLEVKAKHVSGRNKACDLTVDIW